MYALWIAGATTFIFWLTLFLATPRIETKIEKLIEDKSKK